MTQIRLIRFVAIILTVVISSAGQSVIKLPNCTSVCGFKVLNDTHLEPEIERSTDFTFHNTSLCVENAKPPITAWNRSAHDFMRFIGMNDEKFGCPMENSLITIGYQLDRQIFYDSIMNLYYAERNILSIGPTLPKDLVFLSNEIRVDEPDNIPGFCYVTSTRAVKRRLPDNRFTTDWLASIPLYDKKTMVTEGVIFSAINETSGSPLNIRVPKNVNDSCIMNNCTSFSRLWLPASTFNTSANVSQPKNKYDTFLPFAPSYSMLAKFDFDELPGAKEILEKLKDGLEDVENVRNDLSPSNLAILSLPLLMAIPPLSLLGPASDGTIAWYAFATDILAAIPLMIKGIEIVLLYRKANPNMISSLGLSGEKFQIFEMWYIRCEPPEGRIAQDGVKIVAVSFWFMVASTYAEFLFWREMRYREGRLKKFEDDIEGLPDIKPMNNTASETDCALKRILRSCLRGRRKYFAVFSVILAAEFFVSAIIRWVAAMLFHITLVVFRAVLVKRFRQLIHWRFWVGVVLGFVTGPVYLLMHVFENVRKSGEWEMIVEGCNAGFGFLVLTFGLLIRFRMRNPHTFVVIWERFAPLWVYGAAVIFTHAIRSEASDRKAWRYGCHGFALGMLFGPLGLLFKRCFPESVEHKRVRLNFLGGLVYGMIFGITLIYVAVFITYRIG